MPFPSNLTTVDNFNRANGGLGANWTIASGTGAISSNTAKATAVPLYAAWNPTTFGADQDVWCDLTTKNAAATAGCGLLARWDTAAANAYFLFFDTNSNLLQFYKQVAGSATQLGSNTAVTLASGDGIGFRCLGNRLSAWRRSSGTWLAELAAVTDSTYTGGGKIGVEINDTTTALDNFGGGEYVTLPKQPRRVSPRQPAPSGASYSQ